MDYSQDTEVQREILSRIQKIKDEQIESKRRAEIEEERRQQEREKIKREQFIQEQISIALNSEKYESLTEEEKNIMYFHHWIHKNSTYYGHGRHNCLHFDSKEKCYFSQWYINKESISKYQAINKYHTLYKNHNKSTICTYGLIFIPESRFKHTYSYMNNIMDKYEVDKKTEEYIEYLIHLNNEELKIENERKAKETEEARLKIEQQRFEQLNKSLDQFIKHKGNIGYSGDEFRQLGWFNSKQDLEFETKFWNYIDNNNGFSRCPVCDKVPQIIRYGSVPIQYYSGGGGPGYGIKISKGLFYKSTYESPPIENIHCCSHLYDFTTKKRYILASVFLSEKPKKEFHINAEPIPYQGYKTTSYVEYNPLDPYGEEAKKQQDKLASLKELEELEVRMRILKKSLNP